MQTPLFQPHHSPAVEGEMSSREDTLEPGTSAANASQVAPTAPQDNQENAVCPECRDISTVCSSSCRHCFCHLCLWDWTLSEAVCPRCQRPTRHPYPQHVALYHEVQDRVYNGKRRWRSHSAQQPRSCSRRFVRFGPRERRQRRSVRWAHDGRWRSQHSQGSDSPRRRWQRRRRAWEDIPGEGRAPRFEWDVLASSRPPTRRRFRRSWSQQERSWGHRRGSRGRRRSHGRNGWQGRSSRRGQDSQPGSHDRSTGRRRWRSWNADDRHTPRSQRDTSSESSETHEREDSDSSGQQHATRSRTWGRSHRRGHNSQGTVPHDRSAGRRRWRSWNDDDTHTPRSQYDTSSGISETHQWEDWDSSGQQHTTRSQTRGRSHRRGQDTKTNSQEMVHHDHSTRQRRWRSWNPHQGQAPESQQDIPGSSGRSQNRRKSQSHARHRDT